MAHIGNIAVAGLDLSGNPVLIGCISGLSKGLCQFTKGCDKAGYLCAVYGWLGPCTGGQGRSARQRGCGLKPLCRYGLIRQEHKHVLPGSGECLPFCLIFCFRCRCVPCPFLSVRFKTRLQGRFIGRDPTLISWCMVRSRWRGKISQSGSGFQRA